MLHQKIIIREAEVHDLLALTALINELGYPTTLEEMQTRFEYISNHKDYKTFVALYDDYGVGMIGLIKNAFYEKNGFYVRVAALVVNSSYRRMGVGKELIQRAEEWALASGTDTLLLNSGDREERKAAHLFYLHLGFEQKSLGFVKKIAR